MLFPGVEQFVDWSLLLLRIVIAVIFISSGLKHLANPSERGEGIGFSPSLTIVLGAVEILGGVTLAIGLLTQLAAVVLSLIMVGAIFKKAFVWRTGFFGKQSQGWNYDLLILAANAVIFTTGGGVFAVI